MASLLSVVTLFSVCSPITRLPKAEGEDCTLGGSKERESCTVASPHVTTLLPQTLAVSASRCMTNSLTHSPHCKDRIYSVSSLTSISAAASTVIQDAFHSIRVCSQEVKQVLVQPTFHIINDV